jgi:hypothetical protein
VDFEINEGKIVVDFLVQSFGVFALRVNQALAQEFMLSNEIV